MSQALGARRTSNQDVLQSVVVAARECFARSGVHRTRMEDVAQAAGMARQAIYRYVSGRDELIELALMERCREFLEELSTGTDDQPGELADAIVDLMIRAVEVARQDEEFGYLAEAVPRTRLNLLLTSADSPMHGIVGSCFETLFARADEERLLRTDVSHREMIEWLQAVLTVFTPRTDLEGPAQRRILREFALRGFLR